MFDPATLWDFNDPAASEAAFRDHLAGVTDPDDALIAKTQIARAQGLQRNFDAAHAALDDVEASLADADPPTCIRYLLERGRVFNSSGEGVQARRLFEEAWEVATQNDEDALAVDAAHMLAIVTSGVKALQWNERALARAEASTDDAARRWAAPLHNNIGWTCHDAADFDTALRHFEKALELRVVRREPGNIRIARWCVARCLRSLDRVTEALDMQQVLLKELSAAGETDGYVHEELAECLHAIGETEESRRHFSKAYKALADDAWFAEAEADRLQRMREMSEG